MKDDWQNHTIYLYIYSLVYAKPTIILREIFMNVTSLLGKYGKHMRLERAFKNAQNTNAHIVSTVQTIQVNIWAMSRKIFTHAEVVTEIMSCFSSILDHTLGMADSCLVHNLTRLPYLVLFGSLVYNSTLLASLRRRARVGFWLGALDCLAFVDCSRCGVDFFAFPVWLSQKILLSWRPARVHVVSTVHFRDGAVGLEFGSRPGLTKIL